MCIEIEFVINYWILLSFSQPPKLPRNIMTVYIQTSGFEEKGYINGRKYYTIQMLKLT